ncbi:MAG: hypothetical protein HYY59_08230 [Candidatus Omnitrophica bacterium]|nr:hypothetical protein [Candidatus Omnitrophota bacterium]
MTDAQIFCMIGLVYLTAGLGSCCNPGFYQRLLKSFQENPAVVFLSGLLALVVGFLLVTFHNVWAWEWSTIITVFGWLTLARGLFTLAAPAAVMRLMAHFSRKPPFFMRGGFIMGFGVIFLALSVLAR